MTTYNNAYARALANRNRYQKFQTPWGFEAQFDMQDPWYNLGSALGLAWGANYNQRGAKKAADTASAESDAYMAELQKQQQQSQSQQGQQPISVGVAADAGNKAIDSGVSLYNLANKAGVVGGQPNGIGISVSPPPRDSKIEALDYFYNKYANSPSNNPDGDATKASKDAQTINSNISAMDVAKLQGFNGALLRERIKTKLKQDGRNDWQIQQAMDSIAPTITQKQTEFNDGLFGQLKGVLDESLKAGDVDKSMMTLAKMQKLNPEMAKALSPRVTQAFKNLQRQQQLEDDTQYYMKNFGMPYNVARNYAAFKNVYDPVQQAQMAQARAAAARTSGGGTKATKEKTTTTKEAGNPKFDSARGTYIENQLKAAKEANDATKINFWQSQKDQFEKSMGFNPAPSPDSLYNEVVSIVDKYGVQGAKDYIAKINPAKQNDYANVLAQVLADEDWLNSEKEFNARTSDDGSAKTIAYNNRSDRYFWE